MKAPLIPLNEDFKWKLLSEILNVFAFRSCRQILTKRGILPLSKSKKWQNSDELTKSIEQAANSNGININLPVTKKILKN